MGLTQIRAQIDREIALLEKARALLSGSGSIRTSTPTAAKAAPKKRNLSPEGRKRIADAVKRRWAEQRKAASAKSAAGK